MCPISASPPEMFLEHWPLAVLSPFAFRYAPCSWIFGLKCSCFVLFPYASKLATAIELHICAIGFWHQNSNPTPTRFLRKEVIQPHLPIRLPCYDFTPVINPAFDGSFIAVRSPASGIIDSHGVTGGVYKTRERIHRSILICDY